jgi:hypothetical protein
MNLHDYLIDLSGHDWAEILSGWVPPLPETLTIWMVDRFGDLFAVLEDESVWALDLVTGSFTKLAKNRDQFSQRIDEGDNANLWLMIPMIDKCVALDILLEPGQCYGFKIHPLLGGSYDVANVRPWDLAKYFAFMANVYQQLIDVPDGTKVRVAVERETEPGSAH